MFWIFLALNVGTVRILFCLDPDPYRFCLDPYKMTRIPNTSWNCEVTLQKILESAGIEPGSPLETIHEANSLLLS